MATRALGQGAKMIFFVCYRKPWAINSFIHTKVHILVHTYLFKCYYSSTYQNFASLFEKTIIT